MKRYSVLIDEEKAEAAMRSGAEISRDRRRCAKYRDDKKKHTDRDDPVGSDHKAEREQATAEPVRDHPPDRKNTGRGVTKTGNSLIKCI